MEQDICKKIIKKRLTSSLQVDKADRLAVAKKGLVPQETCLHGKP